MNKKWINRAAYFLGLIGGLLYIAAKIHFFTRFGKLGLDDYIKVHYLFWLGFLLIGGLLWILSRV